MKKNNLKIIFPAAIILAVISIGWGSTGHQIISNNVKLFFPEEMNFLSNWQDSLSIHSSDADYRKGDDPNEGIRHYIDIDNYPEFVSDGFIFQDYDSLVAKHGKSFVDDQGVLPWAILSTYDSLKHCFERKDWHIAMLTASDLGHYVGDAHMPLHIATNYNGQLSGQRGIHSRYESQMIGKYANQIKYDGGKVDSINNVSDYVFNFIYNDYKYVDSLLAADIYAKNIAGGDYNDVYYQKLWEECSEFTIYMFQDASLKLTSLIYKAWLEAGSPTNVTSVNDIGENIYYYKLSPNYPNPFNPSTQISYSIAKSSTVDLRVYDILGREVAKLVNETQSEGNYTINFEAGNLSSGIYIYTLNTNDFSSSKKMVLLR